MLKNGSEIVSQDDTKIYFTQFTSQLKPVVKTYKADFTKTTGANLSLAQYKTLHVTNLKAFDSYLTSLGSHDTITLGLTLKIFGLCKTAEAVRKGSTSIYRGKEHVKFLNDLYPYEKGFYSLLFMDIDYDEDMPKHFKLSTPQEVRESLGSLIPELQEVGMLIRPSSSANIYNSITGEYRSSTPSYHVYIVVANSTEASIKRLVEYLKRRAWREDVNLAYMKQNGTGIVERYYLDLAVFSAERLIIESKPDLEYPLQKIEVPSVIIDGEVLDLSVIDPQVETDYRERLNIEKSKILPAVPETSKKLDAQGNTTSRIAPTRNNNDQIIISDASRENILAIYSYLQTHTYVKYKELSKYLTQEVVAALVMFLGYELEGTYKFKIRDEKTASTSINYNGFIKDFGGDFAGNVIQLIMLLSQTSFTESWKYFQNCFGKKKHQLCDKLKTALPNPKSFEQRLTTKN